MARIANFTSVFGRVWMGLYATFRHYPSVYFVSIAVHYTLTSSCSKVPCYNTTYWSYIDQKWSDELIPTLVVTLLVCIPDESDDSNNEGDIHGRLGVFTISAYALTSSFILEWGTEKTSTSSGTYGGIFVHFLSSVKTNRDNTEKNNALHQCCQALLVWFAHVCVFSAPGCKPSAEN